jgi:uncharacterized alkaline shock family protein YloU
MKVVNAFINIFSVFVFLTLGSFLVIVAFQIVSQEEALRAVTEVYAEPLRTLQAGLIGLLFIIVGLTFAKILLKSTRGDDVLIFHGENGTITVAAKAIEDLVAKVVRKFSAVKESKIKTVIRDHSLSLRIKLIVWSGVLIPEITREVQSEVKQRLERMLGLSERTEILVNVQKVILSKGPKS